jgi:NADPH:quinone reductase-like Zn-dependent oxidoreductase
MSKHAAFVSDSVMKDGLLPGIKYPKVPGHEVAGIVDKVGSGVTEWRLDNESASVGTVAIVVSANIVDGGTSFIVNSPKYQGFHTMMAMQII